MTTYTATVAGQDVIIHAPELGQFDENRMQISLNGHRILGLDVEGSAINDKTPGVFASGRLRLVQVATNNEAWVLTMSDPTQVDAAKRLLSNPEVRFVTHSTYDILTIWSALGIWLGQRVLDTLLLHQLAHPGSYYPNATAINSRNLGGKRIERDLKTLSEIYLDTGLREAQNALIDRFLEIAPDHPRCSKSKCKRCKTWGWNNIDTRDESYLRYAGLDAIYVRRLLPLLIDECRDFPRLVQRDHWLAQQMLGITRRGIKLDRERTLRLRDTIQREVSEAKATFVGITGFLPGSSKAHTWFETRGVEFTAFTKGGQPSMDKAALAELLVRYPEGEVGDALRAKRDVSIRTNSLANLNNFLVYADEHDRIHPEINTLQAKTGRMSITRPALQTLKKTEDEETEEADMRLRACFVADDGHVLISADFKGIEVRVAAALSGEQLLIDAIKAGDDTHSVTASLMFGEEFTSEPEESPKWKKLRKLGKICTFLTVYGGGVGALVAQTGVSREVAADVIDRFRRAYPKLRQYGYDMQRYDVVTTLSSRRIPADDGRRYANTNYSVQPTARDLLVAAHYRLVTETEYGDSVVLPIHDEFLLQVPVEKAEHALSELVRCMTMEFRGVPIEAEGEIHGKRWTGDVKAAA